MNTAFEILKSAVRFINSIFAMNAAIVKAYLRFLNDAIPEVLNPSISAGRHPCSVPGHTVIIFPSRTNLFCCGLAGIVYYKEREANTSPVDISMLTRMAEKIETGCFSKIHNEGLTLDDNNYLGGKQQTDALLRHVQALKCGGPFYEIFTREEIQRDLKKFSARMQMIINEESHQFREQVGRLSAEEVETMSSRIETLRDIAWGVTFELIDNIKKINGLFPVKNNHPSLESIRVFKNINAVLNSIDRLEVRGRDSAGISLMFALDREVFDVFRETLENVDLINQYEERKKPNVLVNNAITVNESENNNSIVTIALTYKVAAEIGSLGDNVIFLRWQIKNDAILHILTKFSHQYHTLLSHTRWASVGAITEPNCHPVDNKTIGTVNGEAGILHVCLNGDIDNYLDLKAELESRGKLIHGEITTDTKIIPLQVERYIGEGHDIETAFRLAVNDFEGSHAISMHTDLAPGKLFLAQKGSGQTIFIGLAEDHFMPASEVYGFVEETPYYIKMDGEKVVQGRNGNTQGQIFIMDQHSSGPSDGLKTLYYDGTPLPIGKSDIKKTEIMSRDIDRQDFPHYFLKEISESPDSVEKTLQNRWKLKGSDSNLARVILDRETFPEKLKTAFKEGRIRRIFFVGQGTAGVAALACANILDYYLDDPSMQIIAQKASELSGFKIDVGEEGNGMADTLVIAISQSGTTTDTNRTVEMVMERGAYTLAIVNRRDSDITFKVDGVMYTSNGRDIEMSVASTKAFYSQIVAGALLGLKMAELSMKRSADFVSSEIERLLEIPSHMRKILAMKGVIQKSADRLTTTKTYWAAVGSGPNKTSADEIRIKLSELCYKTLSSDFIEDKKHIDLSSEPLIIVCAAGSRPTVIGDIIKDTAIFKAHKATPVVIANEGEHRFDPYAADVFYVPAVAEHLAPIVNTLVGHIWGYYAALAINDGSEFFFAFRENLQRTIEEYARKDLNIFEVVLEKDFRKKIVLFYGQFREKKAQNKLPSALGLKTASDLTLLLKYLSGKLPDAEFEFDFGKKGTALNMINTLLECLGESINTMARPVDAIKHQAKTVTVGTSRIRETVEGILFDELAEFGINISRVTNKNVIVLRNLQGIVSRIEGAILYKIGHLDELGEPTEGTTIKVVRKEGVLKPIPSRAETDFGLKGLKRIIVREKNVWIGTGKKDDRNIIVIPIISTTFATENIIENLLLLNISFRENVSLPVKIQALGYKFNRIKNHVQENSVPWVDELIDLIGMRDLFGLPADRIGDKIVTKVS